MVLQTEHEFTWNWTQTDDIGDDCVRDVRKHVVYNKNYAVEERMEDEECLLVGFLGSRSCLYQALEASQLVRHVPTSMLRWNTTQKSDHLLCCFFSSIAIPGRLFNRLQCYGQL